MISIVIPAYNAEKYIERTVASIAAQTLKEYEIIVVNDGSTDGTGAILDRLAATTPGMRVIHIANGGAYAARLRGISEARGEWVTFCDADDTMRPDALERLLSFTREDIDIAVGTLNLDNRSIYRHKVTGDVTPDEYMAAILRGDTTIGNYAKLYRRNLFEGVPSAPRQIVQNEDLLLLLHVAMKARMIRIEPECVVYDYIFRAEGISKSVRSPLETWLLLFGMIEKMIGGREGCREAFVNYRLHTLHDALILSGTFVKPGDKRITPLLTEAAETALDEKSRHCLRLLDSSWRQRGAHINHVTRQYLIKLYHKLSVR